MKGWVQFLFTFETCCVAEDGPKFWILLSLLPSARMTGIVRYDFFLISPISQDTCLALISKDVLATDPRPDPCG